MTFVIAPQCKSGTHRSNVAGRMATSMLNTMFSTDGDIYHVFSNFDSKYVLEFRF